MKESGALEPARYFIESDYHSLWREEVLRQTIRRRDIPTSLIGVLLEIGCGEGRIIRYVLTKFKSVSLYVGLDISIHMLNYAKDSTENRGKVEFILADGRYLPFRSEAFHAVLCIATAQYMPNKNEFIEEVSRVLKDNGVFVCDFPDMRNIKVALHFAARKVYNILHKHLRRILRKLAILINAFSFTTPRRYGLNTYWLASLLTYGATPFFPSRASQVFTILQKAKLEILALTREGHQFIILAKKERAPSTT